MTVFENKKIKYDIYDSKKKKNATFYDNSKKIGKKKKIIKNMTFFAKKKEIWLFLWLYRQQTVIFFPFPLFSGNLGEIWHLWLFFWWEKICKLDMTFFSKKSKIWHIFSRSSRAVYFLRTQKKKKMKTFRQRLIGIAVNHSSSLYIYIYIYNNINIHTFAQKSI